MKRCPKCGKTFLDDANFCPVDAGRLVEVSDAAASGSGGAPGPSSDGLVGGRFELGAAIGGSVTGAVHRAIDQQDRRAVAVKIVEPTVLAIPAVAQRIERELKQLERVNHKAVAHVVASGRLSGSQSDKVFIATELVEGARPLSELIAASGPVDPQRASDLVLAIGEGLIEAAKVGVVHRDLSPKNVLVTQDTIKLINFCVPVPNAKAPGVPEYVAPEAIEGKPIDQRGNIYSLAAMYYFLLTGRPPHVGEPAAVLQAHLAGSVEPPSKHAAVPADIDTAVGKALERNAARRYLTLRQFLDEIERIARGPEGGTGATAPFGKAGKPRELAQTLMGFGGLGAAKTPSPENEARTRQMDVQPPAEARRDASGGAGIAHDTTLPQTGSPLPNPAPAPPVVTAAAPAVVAAPLPAAHPAASPWSAPVAAMQQAAPAIGAAAAAAPQSAPQNEPYAPAAAAMQQAAPAMGAAAAAAAKPSAQQPAAPAAPKLATTGGAGGGGGQGKKKADDKDKKASKGKFRETMWFKKGDLDAAAAEEAAAAQDANATDKADTLPIDERYTDDGSITRGDADKYSLRTGNTSMMPAMKEEPAPSGSVSERELVGEMKGGRNLMLIGIVVGLAIVIGIVLAFTL